MAIQHDTVSLKRRVMHALDTLPDDASYEEILDCLETTHAIEVGLEQIERGEVVSHEEVMRRVGRWLR